MNDHAALLKCYLPHRHPMLMVDGFHVLTEIETSTHFFIHKDIIFMENKHLSASGLLEHIAQSSSLIIGKIATEARIQVNKRILGFISQIKKIKIHALPSDGNTIVSHAKLLSQYDQLCSVYCESFVGNRCLAEAEISLLITEEHIN